VTVRRAPIGRRARRGGRRAGAPHRRDAAGSPAIARARRLLGIAAVAAACAACGVQYATPRERAYDARFGKLGGEGPAPSARACADWSQLTARDPYAAYHVSYPETDPVDACFTRVTHRGHDVRADEPPRGCAYPDDAARARLVRLADYLDREGAKGTTTLFPCALSPKQRAAAARHDAVVLRRLAVQKGAFPYAAVIVPGHGLPEQSEASIVDYLPDDSCRALGDGDLRRFGAMVIRARRAADAIRGGVAPVAIVSGGAVHSRLVEAFAMLHLLTCVEHEPPVDVLVEPCAEHTHTNLRNAGRWLVEMDARAAYLVTDDFLQSEYFQDFSGFELLLGSIDQRSLRDFGYLLGSWRRASRGMKAGFWFTPYRFWAEPREGAGSFSCVEAP